MANFLITTANKQTNGSSTADTIVTNTAGLLGASIFAGDGGDLISAAAAGNGVNAILNGQQGNDTITIANGADFTVGKIIGGGGNDFISAVASSVYANTTIHGGNGTDTITFGSATFSSTTINGNGGHDLISAGAITAASTLIAMGGGNDTLTIATATVTTSTFALGGGNDFLTATTFSGTNHLRIEGDTIGDSEFYGNDTIHINDGTLGVSALVQGGGGADQLLISAFVSGGTTINGNAGKDSINIGAANLVTGGASIFAGGAGNDTITVSAAINSGTTDTIFGGGQDDVIDLISATTTGAGIQLVGGEGADTFNLGATVLGGKTAANIRYTSFAESTLGSNDFVSATVNLLSGYVISQSVLTATTAGSLNAGGTNGLTTDARGVVTFGASVGNDLTARMTVLDKYTTKGQAAGFADGSGNNYLFINGGSTGNADDLLVNLNDGITAFTIQGGTAIEIGYAA
jgi:hypothetical protein